MALRFLKRGEPDHSMVSVILRSVDGRARGEVFLPMGQQGDTLSEVGLPDGGALSAAEALGVATTHAFDLRSDIAVVDEEGLWRKEWGTLRDEASAPAEAAHEDSPRDGHEAGDEELEAAGEHTG